MGLQAAFPRTDGLWVPRGSVFNRADPSLPSTDQQATGQWRSVLLLLWSITITLSARRAAMSVSIASSQPPDEKQAKTLGKHLLIDPQDFLPCFNARACFVHHRLQNHPLFAMPRLLELAQWLPRRYVRINSGNVPICATPDQIPGTGQSIEESFER